MKRGYELDHTESILIVEDEVISAKMMMLELKRIGFSTLHHVTTGEKAVIYAQECIPDIILMDIRLAGILNGIEAAAIIMKAINPMIIFLTGYNDPEMKDRTELMNTKGFIVKPVNIDILKKLIVKENI